MRLLHLNDRVVRGGALVLESSIVSISSVGKRSLPTHRRVCARSSVVPGLIVRLCVVDVCSREGVDIARARGALFTQWRRHLVRLESVTSPGFGDVEIEERECTCKESDRGTINVSPGERARLGASCAWEDNMVTRFPAGVE